MAFQAQDGMKLMPLSTAGHLNIILFTFKHLVRLVIQTSHTTLVLRSAAGGVDPQRAHNRTHSSLSTSWPAYTPFICIDSQNCDIDSVVEQVTSFIICTNGISNYFPPHPMKTK